MKTEAFLEVQTSHELANFDNDALSDSIIKNQANNLSIQDKYLYIGCKDSLEPSASYIGIQDKDIYEMRKMKKFVDKGSKNMMHVIHYAIEQLNINHIIVCGHYNCPDLKNAHSARAIALKKEISIIEEKYADDLSLIPMEQEKQKMIVEIGVIEQCKKVEKLVNKIMPKKAHDVSIYSWVYDSRTETMIDLEFGAAVFNLAPLTAS